MKKNTIFYIIIFNFLLFVVPLSLLAQPIDPCDDPAAPCPIDSNIVVLIVIALVIAAKKTYSYKKNAPTAIL